MTDLSFNTISKLFESAIANEMSAPAPYRPFIIVRGRFKSGKSSSLNPLVGTPKRDTDSYALITTSETLQRFRKVDFFPQEDINSILTNPGFMHQLSPRKFEELTAELLNGLGYKDILLTPPSADGGIDVFATKEVNGIPIILGCECKRYAESRKIGLGTVRSLLG